MRSRNGPSEAGARSLLVLGVLFVHSLPEGFAIGSAFASTQAGISVFVITAIAIQNVPEGTATAAAMQPAGYGRRQQVWGAILTSAPQMPGALVAWLAVEQISGLLPISFALAGGAMLALVVIDLLPDAWQHASHERVVAGTALGAAAMLAVGAVLQVLKLRGDRRRWRPRARGRGGRARPSRCSRSRATCRSDGACAASAGA